MAKSQESTDAKKSRQADKRLLKRFVPEKAIDDQFGRPNVVDVETLLDLKYAFVIGCTVEESAHYAGISKQTYYNFIKGLSDELQTDFLDLVEGWKDDMIVKSRKTLSENAHNPQTAQWILERRRKDEFAPRTQHEIKEVTDFDNLDDSELAKIANASKKATDGILPTPKRKPRAKAKARK